MPNDFVFFILCPCFSEIAGRQINLGLNLQLPDKGLQSY